MKQNKERFEAYYTYENDENLRGHRDNQGIIEFLTTQRYMERVIPPGAKILDACAGCGAYAFFLAELGHMVTAGDLVEHNISEIRKKQERHPVLNAIYTGSATDLTRFDEGVFDVVLNMGAFYHMTEKEEREKSIAECLRVLRAGGLFFMAYLNRFSNITKYHGLWLDNFDVMEKIFEQGYSTNESLFYLSTPEEIEEIMRRFGLTIVHHVATDGLKANVTETINSMSEEVFRRFMEYHYRSCEVRSILGYTEHALVIAKKNHC